MYYIYFDTSYDIHEAQLLKRNMRLRVRVKKGKYSLELKIKSINNNAQEFKQKISERDLASLFEGSLVDGEIRVMLENVDGHLINIKTAHTTRAKRNFQNGILVLDKTVCRGKTRFEIEFRSFASGLTVGQLKRGLKLMKKAAIISKLMFM